GPARYHFALKDHVRRLHVNLIKHAERSWSVLYHVRDGVDRGPEVYFLRFGHRALQNLKRSIYAGDCSAFLPQPIATSLGQRGLAFGTYHEHNGAVHRRRYQHAGIVGKAGGAVRLVFRRSSFLATLSSSTIKRISPFKQPPDRQRR